MLTYKTNTTLYALMAMMVFIMLGIPAVLSHELWLDEANTFLTVRDTHGWHEFYQVLRYEGHPWLWCIMIKAWVMMGGNYVGMQFIHMLTMAATVYMLWKYSPFKVMEKLAISTGYFFMYEYSLISRDYALGLLLLLITLVLLHQKKYIIAVVVASICFQTHLHFFLLSFLLVVPFIWTEKKQVGKLKIFISGFFILGGIFLLYLQVKDAGEHGYFQYTGFTAFSAAVLQRSLAMPLRAFFPFSDPVHFSRDGNLLLLLPKVWIVIPALVAMFYPFLLLKRSRRAVVYYALVLVSILLISCMSAQPAIQMRHCGTLWVGFLGALWISRQQIPYLAYSPSFGWEKVGRHLFMISLLVHIYAAILALYMDARYPFSEGKNTAAWISEHCPDELIVCAHHFNGPPIAVYLERSFYYPERKTMGTYCIWNTNPFMISAAELREQVQQLVQENKAPFILILNDEKELPAAGPNYQVTPLARFDHSIVRSENFYIYRVGPPMRY